MLQFNPEPYFQAYQSGLNSQNQARQQLQEGLNQIPQGIQSYIEGQNQQKQDRMNQLLTALKLKEQGIDPTNPLQYLATGKLPMQQPASIPSFDNTSQPPVPSQTPMFGNRLNLSAPQEASAGTPDTGYPSLVDLHNKHLQLQGKPGVPKPQQMPQQMGFGALLQSTPTNYAGVINDIKGGNYDSFNALTEKDKDNLKELPAFKALSSKTNENYTPEQAQAIMSGNPQMIAKAFPDGVPRTAVSPAVSAAGAEGRNKYFGTRASATFMNELPSNTSPNEPAGAAYAVKVAVRQGQSLINKAGSPQAIALAASDLARAVQRSAPQMDVIRGGGFSDNFITRLNMIAQKFTADPSGSAKDVPKVRKEMFDMLGDLDRSAQPWIDNKLKDIESNFSDQLPQDWEQIKKRQRGETLTPVQFDSGSGQGGQQQIGRFKVTVH